MVNKVFYELKILIFSIIVAVALFFTPFNTYIQNYVAEGGQYLNNYSQSYSVNKLTPMTDQKGSINSSYASVLNTQRNVLGSNTISLTTTDSRIQAMREFLIDYNSPLYPYAETFVVEADKYGLDWRLVASISGVESAFGRLIPRGTNNGWGWRGGPAGAYSIFPTWNDGIAVVTQGLAIGYGTNLTPFQIERWYCPPCYANPQHAWANGVTRFMNELEYYNQNLEEIR